jgi:putative addiction module killer protein
MNTIVRTEAFDVWLAKLKDARGKARIIERIRSAERGNFGDCESIGHGVSEMCIHFGPGYRVYLTRVEDVVYVLLCGGTKRSQQHDIAKAQEMVRLLKEE